MNRRKFLKRILMAGGAGLLLCSYPVVFERYMIMVNTYKIAIKNLPEVFEGFRIAHLTDIHYGLFMPGFWIEHIVNITNGLKKDITVLTGDYVHKKNTNSEIDEVWPILSKLHAPQGVYAVLGNHDHWASFDRSMKFMESSGFNLRHKVKKFTRGKSSIWLGGAGDYWEDDLKIDEMFSPAPDRDIKILLTHNPDSIDTDYKTHVDLAIAGHTHGGQVNIPFLGTPVLPVRNKRYSSGVIDIHKFKLFISRGIGWAVLPVRFNCAPEIAVLELTRS